jgi:hypothetical protein
VRRNPGRVGVISGALVGRLTAGLVGVCCAAGKVIRARPSLPRATVVGALTTVGVLVSASGALAAIDLGPGDFEPAIQYEPTTQTTYVAWTENEHKAIDLCVLPAGATGCENGAPIAMTDPRAESGIPKYSGYNTPEIVVLPGGGVVLVADLDPVAALVTPSGWTSRGVVAWSSTAGGATFFQPGQGLADSGELLAPEVGSIPGQGAVALGSSPAEVGVFGNANPFGNGFAAFGLTKPFATKESEMPVPDMTGLYDDELGADGTQTASLANTPKSGEALVVTVGEDYSNPNPACPGDNYISGYAYAGGTFANLNKQASWEVGGKYFKPIACVAESPVIAGGPSGIGVFEDEGPGLESGGADSVDYRAFDAATHTFGAPVVVSEEGEHTLSGAGGQSMSQDPAGGIYTMWLDSRGWEFSYSNTQGSSWAAPVTALPEVAGDPVIAGVGNGTAEAAYEADLGGGTHEYLESLNYATLYAAQYTRPIGSCACGPAPHFPPPATTTTTTTQSGAGLSESSLTVTQGTAVTDQARITGANAASATGTVTYNVYKDSKCTVAAGAGSTATVVKGVAGPSAAIKLATGTYYWIATYSGDSANASSVSKCGSEVLVVALQATTLGLPSSKLCLSKRKFIVHPRVPQGVKLVSIEVQINGKTVKQGKLSKHGTTVSLVGLPKGAFKVALITKSSKGKIYEEVRTFHTCVPGHRRKKKK